MPVRVTFDMDEVVRELDATREVVVDPSVPLKKLGAHLRKKAQKHFDEQGPGWPGLAASTIKAREEQFTQAKRAAAAEDVAKFKLKKKLQRELKRATRSGSMQAIATRQAVLDEYSRQVAGATSPSAIQPLNDDDRRVLAERRKHQAALSEARKTKNKHTIARFKAALDSFDAQHASTIRKASLGRAAKSISGLSERLARQTQKAEGKLLGRMASSIGAKVAGGTLTVASKIPWSSVHNEGGEAGKGAHIPKREFLEIGDDDLKLFETLLAEEVAKKLSGE